VVVARPKKHYAKLLAVGGSQKNAEKIHQNVQNVTM
jgi:hypothetical protein